MAKLAAHHDDTGDHRWHHGLWDETRARARQAWAWFTGRLAALWAWIKS